MNENLTKTIIVLSASAIIFYFGRKFLYYKDTDEKENRIKFLKPSIDEKDITDEITKNAFIALEAYIEAWNDGESNKSLEQLNKTLTIQYGVYVDKDDYVLYVKDKDGNKILKYDKK